ncbi:hypothetical protein H2200_003428 [Cladophialophora chaetospira]|uniref:F-box domain-containing protein n=1 Tax=Cladophialophora chaetospira TaxID=386627 RepID=A0AA38XI16_9EURO|nr:hypothetical protein H2200_003428 [Cladophialophora chaetospira]
MATSVAPQVAAHRTINDFSTELLRLVLYEVKRDSLATKDGTIVNVLSVCKLWSQFGASLLYTDIRLSGKQLVKFARQSHLSSGLTRSFTIVLSSSDWTSGTSERSANSVAHREDEIRKIWMAVYFSPQILGPMKNLQSFSLVVLPQLSDRYRGLPYLPLYELVRSLPASIHHLELDVGDFFYQTSDQLHICPLLKKLLRRLMHVRIRLPNVCEDILDFAGTGEENDEIHYAADSDRGRVILIHAVSPKLSKSTTRCSPISRRDEREREHHGNDSKVFLQRMVANAQDALPKGYLRNVDRMSIFDVQFASSNSVLTGVHSAINERTLVPCPKLRKLPIAIVNDKMVFLRFRDSDGASQEAWGPACSIIDIVEGHIWVETEDGYRLPSKYFEQSSRFHGSPAKAQVLLTPDEVKARAYGGLLDFEKQEGRHVLQALESDDLRDIGTVAWHQHY